MKAFVNGRIWQWRGGASDYAHALAEWMLVSSAGEVLRVGSGALPAEAAAADAHDLQGRLVLPGLHDAHTHAYMLGESAEYLDLFGCASFDDLAARLAAYDARHPDKAWIVGFGWAQDKLSPSARYPTRHDIDAVVRDRPVILHRGCWHVAVVNTKALEIAGVDVAQTLHEVQGGGAIDVDDKGVTGILREAAVEIVMKHANEPSLDLRLKYLEKSLQQCVRFGLTAVHSNDMDGWKLHQKLQEQHGLPLRVFMTPSADEINNPDVPRPGTKEGRLSCDRVKIFSDGSLGAETAAVRLPYKGTENKGILMHSDADLVKKIADSTEKGYRVEIHAIGDRAAEQVLKALREAGVSPDKRPILTHCQILGDDLIQQMADQGVIGDIQPSFAITDASFARKRLDDHVLRTSYCWKTMLNSGIVCAGGSDAPIETCNPFQGIFDAIYRHKPNHLEDAFLPEEALTFNEALSIYTRGGAFAAMEETRLGQLAPGYRADFVVLRADVTENHKALLRHDLVDSVWVDGVESFKFDEISEPSLQAHDLSQSSLPGKNGPIRVCHCCRR